MFISCRRYVDFHCPQRGLVSCGHMWTEGGIKNLIFSWAS